MKKTLTILSAGLMMTGVSQAASLALFEFSDTEEVLTDLFSVTTELYAGSTGNVTIADNAWTDGTNDVITLTGPVTTGVADNPISFTYTVTGLAANERLNLTSLAIGFVESSDGDNSVRFSSFINGVNLTGSIDPPTAGTYDTAFSGGSGYTNLQNGDSVLVAFSLRDGRKGPSTINFDNLVLNGDVVVVPEPSSTALLGLGGLALILRRRK